MIFHFFHEGNKKVDRLAIAVSTGSGTEQLLGSPILEQGTGAATASAVYKALKDWNLNENISCMSFDTTSSNTGCHIGACVCLQEEMGKDLLCLACRHHICEIVLEAVFAECFGNSKSPKIFLCERFKNIWDDLDKNNFKTYKDDKYLKKNLKPAIRKEILSFIKKMMETIQPRDDYLEFLELIQVFLNDKKDYTFKKPAGLHRARWMVRVLYVLKFYMFEDQFDLSSSEREGVLRFCLFSVRIYVFAWFKAPCAFSAASTDLSFIKNLKKFESIDKEISAVGIKKMSNHTWYLSEELIPLCLFDDDVDSYTKDNIARVICENSGQNFSLGRERNIKLKDLEKTDIENLKLESFATPNSGVFFEILKITNTSFLSKPARKWKWDEDYLNCKKLLKNLKVVNDVAERMVKLTEDFGNLFTKDEKKNKMFFYQSVRTESSSLPLQKKKSSLRCPKNNFLTFFDFLKIFLPKI